MICSQLDSNTTGIAIAVCLLIILHIIFYLPGEEVMILNHETRDMEGLSLTPILEYRRSLNTDA